MPGAYGGHGSINGAIVEGDDGVMGGGGFRRQLMVDDGPGSVAVLIAAGCDVDGGDLVPLPHLRNLSTGIRMAYEWPENGIRTGP